MARSLRQERTADRQDCLYGIYKAMEVGLLDLATFDKDAYRFFERVECVLFILSAEIW